MTDTGLASMRLHSDQEFQAWLARDLEVRDELEMMIADGLGIDLISLDRLEAFLLARYRGPDDALRLGERGILDAAARHIGLVTILAIDGAAWAIDLENEDNVYYRLPLIRFADEAEECPLSLALAALERRTGHYLRSVIENYEEEYKTETDE